jgi:hypothetical protein
MRSQIARNAVLLSFRAFGRFGYRGGRATGNGYFASSDPTLLELPLEELAKETGKSKMVDLERYLAEHVEPVIADFERNPASVHHAFIACVVTFHAVDYLAHPKKPAILREKWKRESSAFKIVDQIAHAFKHVVSGKNPTRSNLKAMDVVSTPGAFDAVAFDPAAFDVGAVTLENDPSVNVLIVVKDAADFFRRQLN